MIDDLESELSDAVQWFWEKRSGQAKEQRESEDSTRGRRAEVLGGKQMDVFGALIEDILVSETKISEDHVRHDYHATLPGFFRHEKEWDTAVVYEDELLAAIEYKSQASSFGNNFNNRAEEVIGSNQDLYEAYEEGLFKPSPAPWTGYLMLMADTEESRDPNSAREPNFPVDDEFDNTSYVERMELLCLRLVRKRLVNNAAFLLSNQDRGLNGEYWEPNDELNFRRFVRAVVSHINAYVNSD